jgi:AcrR family transcriptional regulator
MTRALRRQPTQFRGAVRVDQLLDACGEVLDELGQDALTTRAVAAWAGSSIGSFYQFFGDKSQLLRAFGERNLERYLDSVNRRLEADPPETWTGLLDVVFDEYVTRRRTIPGFGVVDFALAGDADPSQRLAEQLAETVTRLFRRPATVDVLRALRVAVEAADALVRLAFRDDARGDPVLLHEARTVVRGYLATYLDE